MRASGHGYPSLDILLQDLRYGLRGIRRDKAFATFVVSVVGLGVGASGRTRWRAFPGRGAATL
jgi:hypothetical protein